MNFEDRTYALSIVMNQDFFKELSTWLTEAGLASAPETSIVSGFCDRCVAAGLPLARSLMFIDTLHPIHEGRLFRWGYDTTENSSARIWAHQPGRARCLRLQSA